MSLKRKSGRFLNRHNVFRIHAAIYILSLLLIWYSFVAMLNYPGNAGVPLSVFKVDAIERLSFSLIWGLLIVLHLAFMLGRNWWQQRQVNHAETYIMQSDIQVPSRLLDQQNDNSEASFQQHGNKGKQEIDYS